MTDRELLDAIKTYRQGIAKSTSASVAELSAIRRVIDDVIRVKSIKECTAIAVASNQECDDGIELVEKEPGKWYFEAKVKP